MLKLWLVPWLPVDCESERTALLVELRRELDSTHPLHGLVATPIGRRQDNDDVLFSLADGRVGVVHLTWAGKPDTSPFPLTVLYESAAVFVRECMAPDHLGWRDA